MRWYILSLLFVASTINVTRTITGYRSDREELCADSCFPGQISKYNL